MSFWIPVMHFLQQTRIWEKGKAFFMYYELPNFVFLVLLSAFPFFQLLLHPTLCMLPVCIFLLLAAFLFYVKGKKTKIDILDYLVLSFLLLQASTAFTGFGRAIDALAAVILTSVWFSARLFSKRKGMEHLIFFSAVALLAVSVVGIVEYLFGAAELRWVDARRFADIGGRVTSLFSNPNILAVYLLLMLPLSIGATFSRQKRGNLRAFYAITASLAIVCLFLTWSRGAWLGLFCELAIIALLHSRKTRKLTLATAPLVLLAVPLLPKSVRGRLFSIGDLYESSNRYRLYTWSGTLKMLGEHPFGIGVGERAWRTIYPHYALSGTATVMHAHNIFLQVAVELGAVGLVLFLGILAISLGRAFHRGNLAPAAAICGTLIMGLFDHLWYSPTMLVPFWAMLAFSATQEQKEANEAPFVDILHEN